MYVATTTLTILISVHVIYHLLIFQMNLMIIISLGDLGGPFYKDDIL